MAELSPLPAFEGDVDVVKPLDGVLEQFQVNANLWDELASISEAERRKCVALADLRRGSQKLWTAAAEKAGLEAVRCREEADRWRDAARAVQACFERGRRRHAAQTRAHYDTIYGEPAF